MLLIYLNVELSYILVWTLKLKSDKEMCKTSISIFPSTADTSPLRLSLFPNVPPSINFMAKENVCSTHLPDELKRQLIWRQTPIICPAIKICVCNAGFVIKDKEYCSNWMGTWDMSYKFMSAHQRLKSEQKVNHFPGTHFLFHNKYTLWRNHYRMRQKFGKSEFGFIPTTFCLPYDIKLLRKEWKRKGYLVRWIVKPESLARGVGVKVVNKWSQIPERRPLVVQRYLVLPYLINDSKFDLRLYVLVTSVDPLRIYLYEDGLVRFATNKYTNDAKSLTDIYTHLTNSSINMHSLSYVANEGSKVRQGHLWTLKSLWRYLDNKGVHHLPILDKIKDQIVKTIISAENKLVLNFYKNVTSRYSCFELFGIDIMLDYKLKPWVIEMNLDPDMGIKSKPERDVKIPLLKEVLNMARFHIPNNFNVFSKIKIAHSLGFKSINIFMDNRLYEKKISEMNKKKQKLWLTVAETFGNTMPPAIILDNLTPDDIRHLVVAEDELAISCIFKRIFPTDTTHKYLKFLEKPRYYNLLLAAWETKYSGKNRDNGRTILANLCNKGYHLVDKENRTRSGYQIIRSLSLFSSREIEQKDKSVKKFLPVHMKDEEKECVPQENKVRNSENTKPKKMKKLQRCCNIL